MLPGNNMITVKLFLKITIILQSIIQIKVRFQEKQLQSWGCGSLYSLTPQFWGPLAAVLQFSQSAVGGLSHSLQQSHGGV
uniref:Uncharacterized protein n=1 Tax=Anguilla anguilla TaxID=7936 RepID=A0A0E9TLA4_ANGAN